MAETFKESLEFNKASGDADEVFCDPCKTEDQWIAVEGYCITCDEYLCGNCLSVHKKQKITKNHVVQDKLQMPCRQGSVTSEEPCLEVCKTHHPEIIRFYCKTHDIPGCGDCMTLEHATCKKDRIQDISYGFQISDDVKNVYKKLYQLVCEVEKLHAELGSDLKNLDASYSSLDLQITCARKMINSYLDDMQKEITQNTTQLKKQDQEKLNSFISNINTMECEAKGIFQSLNNSNANVNSTFVITKQAKLRITALEAEIKKMSQMPKKKYQFEITDELQSMMSTKVWFGKLSEVSRTHKGSMGKQHPASIKKVTIDTTATYNRSINVRQAADIGCNITDCAIIGQDKMVVSDRSNGTIKLIELINDEVVSSYSPINVPQAFHGPLSVTNVGTNMVAVTIHNAGKIQLLNAATRLTLHREILIQGQCSAIAYKDERLAVCYKIPGRVNILDMQGKIQHTIKPKQGKKCRIPSFKYPDNVIFGPDIDTVIVSDTDGSPSLLGGCSSLVHVITFSGQILYTYKPDTLGKVLCIDSTTDGVLFICSAEGLHAVFTNLKKSRKIIGQDSHVKRPQAISYCDANQRLYISNFTNPLFDAQDNNNYIQVYDLNV